MHSNLWGFAALIFAGLLVALPLWGGGGHGAQLGGRRTTAIFVLMASGALGMAMGPWLASTAVPISGGVFDFCLIAEALGYPLGGASIRRQLRTVKVAPGTQSGA